jgi:hypothetical protein
MIATLSKLLGAKGYARMESLSIAVVIQDAREAYGRTDVLITPQQGTGTQWVSLERVELEEK